MKIALAIVVSFPVVASLGCSNVVMESSASSANGSGGTSATATSSATGGSGGAGATGGNGGGGSGGGTPCVPVDDQNPCTDNRCAGGMPVHVPKPDGAACVTDACSPGGTCQAGACVGGAPLVCNGGASCVAGACVAPVCTGTIGLPGVPQSPVGNGPSAIVAADLNGDGRRDLVTANTGDNTVSVLLAQAGGTFAPAQAYPTGAKPSAVAVADLNGDGEPDLAVANAGDGAVSVLFGQGNGAFAAAVSYPAGMGPASVAVADLNGDGEPDLAVANASDDTVGVLLNQGGGTFAPAIAVAVGKSPSAVAAGDLNGDGKPDLVIACNASQQASVLINQGNGVFAPAVDYATNAGPTALALADLDGDGSLDLAVVNAETSGLGFPNDALSVFLNHGDGTFAAAASYADFMHIYPLTAVAAADLNGDGEPNLVVSGSLQGTGVVDVYVNQGNGTFAEPVGYGPGDAALGVAVADLNGDGRPDLAVASSTVNQVASSVSGVVSVLENQGDGAFVLARDAGAMGGAVVVVADLNGDGRPDLAVLNPPALTVTPLISQGDGTFAPPVAITVPGPEPEVITAADLDGDGWIDLAVADYDTTEGQRADQHGRRLLRPPVQYAADPGSTYPDFNQVEIRRDRGGGPERRRQARPRRRVHRLLPQLAQRREGPRQPGRRHLRAGSDSALDGRPQAMVAADLDGDGRARSRRHDRQGDGGRAPRPGPRRLRARGVLRRRRGRRSWRRT